MQTDEITPYNLYGDEKKIISDGLGPDISSQRLDELDKESIVWILNNPKIKHVVDLGCGIGGHSIRLATLGIAVWMIDLVDNSRRASLFSELTDTSRLRSIKKDIRALSSSDLPPRIELLYSQRFIHYLKYDEAIKTLALCAKYMPENSRLFISASGISSQLSDQYEGISIPIEQRFFPLSNEMSEKHGIFSPVCLYTKEELSTHCYECGFRVVKLWESEFGNVKGIFEKTSKQLENEKS